MSCLHSGQWDETNISSRSRLFRQRAADRHGLAGQSSVTVQRRRMIADGEAAGGGERAGWRQPRVEHAHLPRHGQQRHAQQQDDDP